MCFLLLNVRMCVIPRTVFLVESVALIKLTAHTEHCTVVERVEKSQNHFFYFFTFYDRFGYGKTYGHNIFNEFHQNHRFLVL